MGKISFRTLFFVTGLFLIIGIPGCFSDSAVPDWRGSSGGASLLPGYAPGSVLVKISDGANASASVLASAHATIGAIVTRDYSAEGISGLQLVKIPDTMPVPDAVSYYQGVPGVAYAEPDYYRYFSAVPSDPDLWRQWGLLNTGQTYEENVTPGISGADIRATQAWNISTGNRSMVAVLDSGVDYTHPDLAANIWTDPKTDTHGYDAMTGTLDPMDQNGHGTHCAGIIGAVANNGIGGSGVNWNTSIMPIRLGNDYGLVSDEIGGINWAVQHGARLVSCSFGSPYFSMGEKEAFEQANNMLFIIAAGNDNDDISLHPQYPASYNLSNILVVAATNANDSRADFSNFGNTTVHLGAPGDEIYSTVRCRYTPVPIWYEPFNTLENWTVSGNWSLDDQKFVSSPYSVSGSLNNLANESHLDPALLTLKYPLNTSGLLIPVLSYQVMMNGTGTSVYLEGSDGTTWYQIDAFPLHPTDSFVERQVHINAPGGMQGDSFMIRFRIDGSGSADIRLDDIRLSDGYGSLSEPKWDYMSGTSMATPMVAGVAGLLLGYAPHRSIYEIKGVILNTTDPLPDLKGKTITGGRINLTAALNSIMTPPSPDLIPVSPGWNHVSVPKRLKSGSDTAEVVFGQLTNTSGHSVIRFLNNTWITIGANESVSPLVSYWLYTTSPQALSYTADPIQSGVYSTALKAGWNGFGVVGFDQLPAKSQLSPVADNWTYAIGYDPITQTYEEPIIKNGTGNQTDLRPLVPTQGYWLYMTGDVVYNKTIG